MVRIALESIDRIAVPFVLFYPVLLVAIIGVFIFAISYLENPSGIMGLVAAGEEVESTEPKKSIFTLMHLWFLYYLFFISISVLFWVQNWIRLYRRLPEPYGLIDYPLHVRNGSCSRCCLFCLFQQ